MGKKRTTMKDVAEAAGVSRTAVSFVLNNIPDSNIPEVTRQRILQAATQLDYVPNTQALNLVTGRTMMIALIVRKTSEQLSIDTFLNEVVHGIMEAIEPRGYHLMIHAARPSRANSSYRALVRMRKVDALLISSPLIDDPEIRRLHDDGTPIVLNGTSRDPDIAWVDIDNRAGARMAVQHLTELGHRRIGHISNAPFSYAASSERLAGYKQALATVGVTAEPALIQSGNFTDRSGFAPMLALLDLPEPPTAVFIGSDTVALGAIEAIHSRGLSIPEDISVIGFDNIPMGRYLNPPLTTVHLPAFDLGQHAGALLVRLTQGEEVPSRQVSLPTELVIRRSTAYRG